MVSCRLLMRNHVWGSSALTRERLPVDIKGKKSTYVKSLGLMNFYSLNFTLMICPLPGLSSGSGCRSPDRTPEQLMMTSAPLSANWRTIWGHYKCTHSMTKKHILKCNLFQWCQSWIFSIITPVFRNHSNMRICC